jgi:hypothetical protein
MVICPHCETGCLVDVKKIRKCGHKVRIRCKCGGKFTAFVECRRACRKETNLVGFYRKFGADEERGRIAVRNVSMTSIGFVTLTSNNLRQGDEVSVEFRLDDERRTKISKNVVVKRIDKDNYVGCEFKKTAYSDNAPDLSDRAIGFYVSP